MVALMPKNFFYRRTTLQNNKIQVISSQQGENLIGEDFSG